MKPGARGSANFNVDVSRAKHVLDSRQPAREYKADHRIFRRVSYWDRVKQDGKVQRVKAETKRGFKLRTLSIRLRGVSDN